MAGTAEARTARVIGPIDVLTPGTTKLATLAPSLNGHSSAYTGGPTTSMTAPTTASSRATFVPPGPQWATIAAGFTWCVVGVVFCVWIVR